MFPPPRTSLIHCSLHSEYPSIQLSHQHPNHLIRLRSRQTCISVLYCVITAILYYDSILPFLMSTAVDGLLLIAVIVVAVTVGKPLSYVDCQRVGDRSGNWNSAYHVALNMGQNLNKVGARLDYYSWVGTTKVTCYQMKAIWGLSIALWYVVAFRIICGRFRWGGGGGGEKGSGGLTVGVHFRSILFSFSAICTVCLWRRTKPSAEPKTVEA